MAPPLAADNPLDLVHGVMVLATMGLEETDGAGSDNLVAAQDRCKVIITRFCNLKLADDNAILQPEAY